MLRYLLAPRWIPLHLLMLVVVVAFGRLGWWQLQVALDAASNGSGGGFDVQNAFYAIQWWLFAGFAVFFWWRWLRDERDAEAAHAAEVAAYEAALAARAGGPGGSGAGEPGDGPDGRPGGPDGTGGRTAG